MAKKKRRSVKLSRGRINKHVILGVAALIVGIPIALGAALQQTSFQNRASAPDVVDINTAYDITSTTNTDGTMGPVTTSGNYSASLTAEPKGSLAFSLANTGYDTPYVAPTTAAYPSQAYYPPTPTTYYAPTATPYPTATPAPVNPCLNNNMYTAQVYGAQDKGKGNGNGNKGGKNGPQDITSLLLCVKKVEVHIAYLGKPGGPKEKPVDRWETLGITDPTPVDIIATATTTAASQLGLTELLVGRYTQVRVYIREAYAKLSDGTTVKLDIPGKANTIKIVKTFTIEEGKSTKLTLDIDPSHSVIKNGKGYMLKPVVAKVVEEH